jgi:hypothetical protein
MLRLRHYALSIGWRNRVVTEDHYAIQSGADALIVTVECRRRREARTKNPKTTEFTVETVVTARFMLKACN